MQADCVTYEAFGATGDGVADDLPAICRAHAYANEHGLSVSSKPEATYHLGWRPLRAVITTDTNWTTSRFTIDDTRAEDHKAPIFEVRSLLEPEALQIDRLTSLQRRMHRDARSDCHVLVENNHRMVYIRKGLNCNDGVPQQDCFILRRDGSIEGDIDWDYDVVTRLEARPMDAKRLVLRGGVFTTCANRMHQEVGYNYWARNIVITRSNTEVDGLTHYVVGETAVGHPYSGFIKVIQCANITLRNCFFTGHKIYPTIGAAGKPVRMGSYDIHAHNVVNFHMTGCRMNHICDRTRWGVIATNLCKNILLEDCTLSRMDTHMGVSGAYTIRRCRLGHQGLRAIGHGLLTVEDSELYGDEFINFRSDYGSTWAGNLLIRNCRWFPAGGDTTGPHMINVRNDGTHDFGYPCCMPREVTIDGLFVDDRHHPADYSGLYIFTDPDLGYHNSAGAGSLMERPFPYATCRKIRLRGLVAASGKAPRISPNCAINRRIALISRFRQ